MLGADGLCVDACADGSCEAPCNGVQCLAGTVLDPSLCTCNPAPCDCSLAPIPPGAVGLVESYVALGGGGFDCRCVPTGCIPGFTLSADQCVEDCPSGTCRYPGSDACQACTEADCCEAPHEPACRPVLCSECRYARDGTDLTQTGGCIAPPTRNTCGECHDAIEDPHPWYGGPELTCAGCHGGDPSQSDRVLAHVPIPQEWSVGAPAEGRPNLRYYYNYLTLAGVERFAGGLEWLRFRDPGDLRIADQSCGKSSGCHRARVENMRRSPMATAAGLIDGARAASGLPRALTRGADGIYKLDATTGMTGGVPELGALAYDATLVGSVPRIAAFAPPDRSSITPYGEMDLLEDAYDKACGGCHLYSAGRNDRFGDFRGSGCSACHMVYSDFGRSLSRDANIVASEPTYPAAYSSIAGFDPSNVSSASGGWLGPERPHPITHRLITAVGSRQCGVCHSGSNQTDLQFRGYQIDPNRTATRALGAGELQLTDEIDNQIEPAARRHGLAQDQILHFVDWNGDGFNDIPADVHYLANLECIDCHTSAELHNEVRRVKVPEVTDWTDPEQVDDLSGVLWSRQEQATEIECADCHGSLDARALPFGADNRNPIRRLFACPEVGETIPRHRTDPACAQLIPGRYLQSKSGLVIRVPQVRDALAPPASEYSLSASIFHGRVNTDPGDGVGPCAAGDPARCTLDQLAETGSVTPDFTHLEGLECSACHAAWTNACFGCHVTLDDTGGARGFSPATGEYTLGRITQAELTFVSPLDLQLGVDARGRVAPFTSAGGLRLRHLDADGLDWYGRRSIVAGDPAIRYGVYRHRDGYGLRPYDQEVAGLLPNADGPVFEQRPEMGANAAFVFNPVTPHALQRVRPGLDCTSCHLGAGGTNAASVGAQLGVRPEGFGGISAYLSRLDGLDIIRGRSGQRVRVDASLGYRLDGDLDPEGRTVAGQLDWVASSIGFPFASTNHPLSVTLDDRHRRDFPAIAPMAGPLGPNLLLRMSDIVVLPSAGN